MTNVREVIVVGSGCTGAITAQTLLERGFKVCMLDVGINAESSLLPPALDFKTIRSTERDQSTYLLGKDVGALWEQDMQSGAQLTPPRQHLVAATSRWLAASHNQFFPLDSLAYGGLGAGWGLGCCVFSDAELEKSGLPLSIREHYQRVADRIGISGGADDATPYTVAGLKNIQPSIDLDANARSLCKRYSKNRAPLNHRGFFLGRPGLALLTRDKENRKAYAYRDMDFYDDHGLSAWRPWITVDKLRKDPAFEYIGGTLVTHFEETAEGINIKAIRTSDSSAVTFSGKQLVLAPGVMGTIRIVLRSMARFSQSIPILCNPLVYIPSLQWSRIGKAPEGNNIGFAQLSLFYDPEVRNESVSMASVYSYHALMMSRIIRQAPLGFRDAKKLFDSLLPAMSIFGVFIPDATGRGKEVRMETSNNSITGDRLHVSYSPDAEEQDATGQIISRFRRAIKSLGCFPVKVVHPGMGSSIHYAGTLPFSNDERPLHISPSGRLYGTRNVFIADGSGFRYLPAKSLTLSLMAWADLVAWKLERSGA